MQLGREEARKPCLGFDDSKQSLQLSHLPICFQQQFEQLVLDALQVQIEDGQMHMHCARGIKHYATLASASAVRIASLKRETFRTQGTTAVRNADRNPTFHAKLSDSAGMLP